jgi:hypothetical protein
MWSGAPAVRFLVSLAFQLRWMLCRSFEGQVWAIFAVWGSALAPTICCIVRGTFSVVLCGVRTLR